MKKYIKTLLAAIFWVGTILPVSSQVLYNNGAAIYMNSGAIVKVNGNTLNHSGTITVKTGTDANLYISGNLTNEATINGEGNIHLNGDWINNATFNCNTGEVLLEGAAQNLSGIVSTTFYDLTLSGSGIKKHTVDQYVSGTLNLNDRELATDNFTMFVTNSAVNAIQRTSGFVSSLNVGVLSRNTSSTSSYLFPVGSSAGTLRYRPVELIPTNNTANTYTVRMANVDATTESYDRSLKPVAICELNSKFYHRINRTSGSSAASMNIYYNEAEDGAWNGIANWTTTPNWQIVTASSTSAGTPMNKASVSNWNNFGQTPYILYMENISVDLGSDQTICPENSATLSVPSGYTYIWSNSATTNSISVNTAGTYSVTVSQGVCSATDAVVINTHPAATVDLGPASIAKCAGETVILDAGSGYTYNWTGGSTSQTINVTTNGTYIVTVTNANGCKGSDQVNVTFQDHYDATITSGTMFCDNATSTTLTAVDAGGIWSGSGITNANTGAFNPSTAGIGTHIVTYTISGSCGDSDDISIEVVASPSVNLGNDTNFCQGESITLDAENIGATFSWNTGSNSQTIEVSTTGTYIVTVSIGGGCSATATVNVNVIDKADASIISNLDYCTNNLPINLSAVDNGGLWSGDGIVNANLGTFNPSNAGVGSHKIIYTIAGSCGDADTATINVNEVPFVFIGASDETCLNKKDGMAWIENIGDGLPPYTYLWENDAVEDTAKNLAPGYWSVIVSDVNGCKSTDTIYIKGSIEPCYITNIYIPNIFSPNGDGNNDILYARGSGIERIVFIVFDRWGEKVFESNSETNGWDGTLNGEDVEEGVYFYYLKAKYLDDNDEILKGNVTLVR